MLEGLGANVKAHGGKLEPVFACGQFRKLAGIEGKMLAYTTKNKDWCAIPDNFIEGLTTARDRSVSTASKACKIAEQMKNQQSGAGALNMPAVKLPAGPL